VVLVPKADGQTVATTTAGKCSAASHWKMKAKPDNGRMELEIDSNRNGQRWAVRIGETCIARLAR